MKITKHRLGKLCDIRIGRTPARANASYWGEGHPWLSIADMKEKYVTRTKEEITDRAVNECNCTIVPKGTLLMSFKLSIGKMAIAGRDMFTNEAIAAFVPKNKDLDVEYLYYALKHYSFGSLNVAAKGATLNKASLALLSVPVPESIDDQRRISALLSRAEGLIAQRKESIRLLDDLVRSVFLEMFGDPISNPYQLPTKTGEELFEFTSGKFNPTKNLSESFSFPCYGGNGLTGFSERYLVDMETLVIGRVGAYCGNVHRLSGKVWITDNAIYIKKFKKDVRLKFMEQQFLLMNFRRFADTVGQPKITQAPLQRQRYLVPDKDLADMYERLETAVSASRLQCIESLSALEQLYGSLSQRAFRGELILNPTQLASKDTINPLAAVHSNWPKGEESVAVENGTAAKVTSKPVVSTKVPQGRVTLKVDVEGRIQGDVFRAPFLVEVIRRSKLANAPFLFEELAPAIESLGLSWTLEEIRKGVFQALRNSKPSIRQVYISRSPNVRSGFDNDERMYLELVAGS